MEPDTNLYSQSENSEIIRENSQKILSVLAAHQIALWEYDISTGKCSFTDDYFRTLGLKEAGIVFKDIDDFSLCLSGGCEGLSNCFFQDACIGFKNITD